MSYPSPPKSPPSSRFKSRSLLPTWAVFDTRFPPFGIQNIPRGANLPFERYFIYFLFESHMNPHNHYNPNYNRQNPEHYQVERDKGYEPGPPYQLDPRFARVPSPQPARPLEAAFPHLNVLPPPPRVAPMQQVQPGPHPAPTDWRPNPFPLQPVNAPIPSRVQGGNLAPPPPPHGPSNAHITLDRSAPTPPNLHNRPPPLHPALPPPPANAIPRSRPIVPVAMDPRLPLPVGKNGSPARQLGDGLRDTDEELPEPWEVARGAHPAAGPPPRQSPVIGLVQHMEVDSPAPEDRNGQVWTRDEVTHLIDIILDENHPDRFALATSKRKDPSRWDQLSADEFGNTRRGSVLYEKWKDLRKTYNEVRDLHTETGNGGLVRIQENAPKDKVLRILEKRLRGRQTSKITTPEQYFEWITGGESSWFARMHERFCDNISMQRATPRHSGRLSPLEDLKFEDASILDVDDDGANADHFPPSVRSKSASRDRSTTPSTKSWKSHSRSSSAAPSDSLAKATSQLVELVSSRFQSSSEEARYRDEKLKMEKERLNLEKDALKQTNEQVQKHHELQADLLKFRLEGRKRRADFKEEERKRQRMNEDEQYVDKQIEKYMEFLSRPNLDSEARSNMQSILNTLLRKKATQLAGAAPRVEEIDELEED